MLSISFTYLLESEGILEECQKGPLRRNVFWLGFEKSHDRFFKTNYTIVYMRSFLVFLSFFVTALLALPFDVEDEALIYLTDDSEMQYTTEDDYEDPLASPNQPFLLASPQEAYQRQLQAMQERHQRWIHGRSNSLVDYQATLSQHNQHRRSSETSFDTLKSMNEQSV
jgi:hypothetical protein